MNKILIVDDDPDLRETLAEIIQKAGYDTDVAACGAEALEKAGLEKFDIIVLDLVMPGITRSSTMISNLSRPIFSSASAPHVATSVS